MTSWRRAWILAFVLAGVSAVGSLVIGAAFFENLSINNDEAVYVLQAEALGSGDLTLSDSLHGDAFRPWMSGRVGGDRLVLVEQPVLPALMAASDALFGTMRGALALIAAAAVLSVFALARQMLASPRIALFAATCFAFSPLVIVQSALFLSYVLAVALAATSLAFTTRGVDALRIGRSAWRSFVLAGVALGLLLFTRPLEGIALSILTVVWLRLRSGNTRAVIRSAPVVAAATLPIVVVALAYNSVTTGDPLTFALWTIGGDDSFGFGYRSIAEHANHIYVGPSEAWLALRTNVRAFPHWLVGGLASIPLGAWGAWRLWRSDRATAVFLFICLLAYPTAYFFYYGNYLIIGGRNLYGPHYYLPLLIPAVLLLGVGLADLSRREWYWPAAAALAIVAGMSIEVGDKVRENLDIRSQIDAEVAAVESAVVDPAIVILPVGIDGPYVLHPRGAFRNPPDLVAGTLFAADMGPRNLELVGRFPDRRFYRFDVVTDVDGTRPQVQPLGIERGAALRFGVTAPSVHQVMIGSHHIRCAPSSTAATVTVSNSAAMITGCTDAPTSVDLSHAAVVLRVSTGRRGVDRAREHGGHEVDHVDLVYEIGPDATGRDTAILATFTPPELWSPVGPDGQDIPIAVTLAPWLDASVTAVGAPT